MVPQSCSERYFLIDPRQIHYLRFLVEAYGGIGVVSTVDPALGLVRISVAPGCEPEISAILEAERENLKLRETVPDPDFPAPPIEAT